ncbi:MAG: hypothetical protein AAFN41_10550, partial [Planctomycetota bacterium]
MQYAKALLDGEMTERDRLATRGRFVVGSVSGVVALIGVGLTLLSQSSFSNIHEDSVLLAVIIVAASMIPLAIGLAFGVYCVTAYANHVEEEHGVLSAK